MLQLLYSIYTETRRRSETQVPDPARIREIIDDVRAEGSDALETGEIERRIEAKFDADEAKLIKDELALFNSGLKQKSNLSPAGIASQRDTCGKTFFEYTPQFKLLIAGNHKPGLRNVDEAIRRRLHLIPFEITIPDAERDTELADKLKKEYPGILRWAIEGCLAWQREAESARCGAERDG